MRKQKAEAEAAKQAAEIEKKAAEAAKKAAEKNLSQSEQARQDLEDEIEARESSTVEELLKRMEDQRKRFDKPKEVPMEVDSDDEACTPGPSKRRKADHDKCEFDLDGLKTVPAPYKGMRIEGLVVLGEVNVSIRKSIARNEFVELTKMFTGEVIQETKIGNMVFTAKNEAGQKQISNKSDIFYLLYQFGMYYLQIYPEKGTAFLEYLAFLTKMGDKFHAQGLLKLDAALRTQYTSHPQWNWDQTNKIIDRIFNNMARDPDNLKPGALVPQGKNNKGNSGKGFGNQQKQQFRQYNPRPYFPPPINYQPMQPAFFPPPQRFGGPPQGQQGQGQSRLDKLLQENPNIHNERCTSWNFSAKGCKFGNRCARLHACFFCGERGHKEPQCPRKKAA